MIKEALEKSDDDGDTLDLSRRDIDCIGEEAVEMFKSGVGKGQKGVWRCVRSSFNRNTLLTYDPQTGPVLQLFARRLYGRLILQAQQITVPQSQGQQVYPVSSCGMSFSPGLSYAY